jgi:hypothetical protein
MIEITVHDGLSYSLCYHWTAVEHSVKPIERHSYN